MSVCVLEPVRDLVARHVQGERGGQAMVDTTFLSDCAKEPGHSIFLSSASLIIAHQHTHSEDHDEDD